MGLKCRNSLKTHIAKMSAFRLSRIYMKTEELYRSSRMLMKGNDLPNVPDLGFDVIQLPCSLAAREGEPG